MTEEDSSPETKKSKKKEDWAEVEIEIGDINDSITRWEAPYVSDWAIALGNFEE